MQNKIEINSSQLHMISPPTTDVRQQALGMSATVWSIFKDISAPAFNNEWVLQIQTFNRK